MAEVVNDSITVIKQNDPDFPKYLDFEKLRKEGLTHIGNLAGKIWTDHNVHDPGVTILEVLVYALMDLGYKTNLPFEDLIAVQNNNDKDDNFLTPLEIVTNNPVTITDYRKLILDVKGVRNAWLEPVNQEIDLYLNQYRNTLSCGYGGVGARETSKIRLIDNKVHLNGLYKVYIEKDSETIQTDEQEKQLKQDVLALLLQHRNLCEDFVAVDILTPLEIGLCAEVEIESGYQAEKIYKIIFSKVKEYIQPDIRYYTLEELLDKEKTIEDIFAGRPYREQSFGFIDTNELESYDKREEIHLSDLYKTILDIDGVRKIKEISITDKNPRDQVPQDWKYKIPEGQVPVFSVEKTCIDLYNDQGSLRVDKIKIHKTLSVTRQFRMPMNSLNTKVPLGIYREDLEEYYSIQNDFPVVYGIGEDGLPQNATTLRKTQALQLKGYLMFYDQILANYTSQLANIRSLFSLKTEEQRTKQEKRTYYTQMPDSIPGIEKLVRFYDSSTSMPEGSSLAVIIENNETSKQVLAQLQNNSGAELSIGNSCNNTNTLVDQFSFSSTGIRTIYISQLKDSFFNKKYTVQILSDRRGFLFVIQAELPNDILIVGTKRYASKSEARKEAKNIAFIATIQQNYTLITNASDTNTPDKHYFEIIYTPLSYIDLIQELTEDKEEYSTRRQQFLDHLLARFGEEFTEYSLLQYQHKTTPETTSKTLQDQSNYVNKFGEISRNRGKAFDYTMPTWNTNNVSGFEKRVAGLSGITNDSRRNLCNFEVTQSFRLQLKDSAGNTLFRSNRGYEKIEELHDAARKILTQLRNPESYKQLEKSLNGFDVDTIHRIFSEYPRKENIIITKYNYHQQLANFDNEVVAVSKSLKIKSEKIARDKEQDFIKTINSQTVVSTPQKNNEYRLLPLTKNQYLNVNALPCTIDTLITWKWHVNEIGGKPISVCDPVFETNQQAWDHMIEEANLDDFLTIHEVGLKWKLRIDEDIFITGLECYPDAYKGVAAWRQAKVLGSSEKNFTIDKKEESIVINLKNEKGNIIAVSNEVNSDQKDIKTILENCISIFGNRTTKPDYEKEQEKFGFKIVGEDNTPVFVSYCVYDSEKEALQHIETVFKLGESKANYLLSGDQGNPEYNFILRDKYNSFLALPPDHFETATDRTKALNSMMRYFKNNKLPVFVKEEPRRYVWRLEHDEKEILHATSEFSSKARAQADFDKAIVKEALQHNTELCAPHCYEFAVIPTPAQYKFIYGNSDAQGNLNPILTSTDTFTTYNETSQAYTSFIKQLPEASLKVSKEKETESILYPSGSKIPIAIGSSKDQTAHTLIKYLTKIYTKKLSPKEDFVTQGMIENQRGRYEWRFYKKYSPIAINPYRCSNESSAKQVKADICDTIPPIYLKECNKQQRIICPEGNPNQFHYQVVFSDDHSNQFVLNSYIGYNSAEEAEEAWQDQWIDIIQTAANPKEYGALGKISIEETYKKPESNTCDETSFIAVIPKNIRIELEEKDIIVQEYYSQLADLYPIYKESNENASEKVPDSYRFKVVVPTKDSISRECKESSDITHLGTIVWISVASYSTPQQVITAYNHFYNLAGTSNNCKIFCDKGLFYTGLVEVLAESLQEFETEQEAWDDQYPHQVDDCQNCIPGGVREFVYAAEEDKNYIPICDRNYWKFKIVSSSYFMTNHNCDYNSQTLRDQEMGHWISKLENLNWNQYIISPPYDGGGSYPGGEFLYWIGYGYSDEDFCDFMFTLRDSLVGLNSIKKEERSEAIKTFLLNKYKDNRRIYELIRGYDFDDEVVKNLTNYFPVYKTDKGYQYKLYITENDTIITPDGLQPCGCEQDTTIESQHSCNNPYPFISSNYYTCCTNALQAFSEFSILIISKSYSTIQTSRTDYGPYSFQIIDKRKELAYHPQQYESLQEVKNAIEHTKVQVNDVGMHLLEHILLRPKTYRECGGGYGKEYGEGYIENYRSSCLLPICPDYDCYIEWQPDIDKNDPCEEENPTTITYIPGSDPYSFWATLVLPAWAKRFRTLEQRQAFENFLYKEVPALVGLNILWLSPRDMCKFEDAYRQWLLWKEDPTSQLCNSNRISPNCLLSNYIKNLKSEPPCASTPEEQGDCNCGQREDQIPFSQNTTDSIFWAGLCNHSMPAIAQSIEVEPTVGRTQLEESKQETIETESKNKIPVEKETKAKPEIAKPEEPKDKTSVEKETTTQKKVTSKKTTKKLQKKKIVTPTSKKIKKDELTIIRQRKPKYLSNIAVVGDEKMKKTKSYERTVFFIENTPTIASYSKLVDFFNRYSLQKDNNIEGFLTLLKNATWHLLDKLILDRKEEIETKEIKQLSTSLQIIHKKGVSLKKLATEWKDKELGSLANIKPLEQIKKILK
ncbi:hypothetical protein [Aquimarina longa]|uniref:hypothetical protein n=1 Tax=Aquimarina longa TaxID=1080221 RepID=UPI000784C72C|nr:hypothetical protein [Aquimarina longa]